MRRFHGSVGRPFCARHMLHGAIKHTEQWDTRNGKHAILRVIQRVATVRVEERNITSAQSSSAVCFSTLKIRSRSMERLTTVARRLTSSGSSKAWKEVMGLSSTSLCNEACREVGAGIAGSMRASMDTCVVLGSRSRRDAAWRCLL